MICLRHVNLVDSEAITMCVEDDNRPITPEECAYHEVGHVVMFLKFNWLFDYVTICEPSGYGDKTVSKIQSPWFTALRLRNDLQLPEFEKAAMLLLAGTASERIHRNDNEALAPENRNSLDGQHFYMLHERFHDSVLPDREDEFRRLLRKVQGLAGNPRFGRVSRRSPKPY